MINYNKPITDKNGNPIKIAQVAAHHCIRCIKKARALRKIGYTTYGMGNMLAYGTDEYETYLVWKNERQFKASIRQLVNEGVKILEYNNEPHHPAKWIREVLNSMNRQDVKVIVDLHDLDSIRRRYIPIEEREMFNAADGLIYVSIPIQQQSNELHGVTKPNIVLYSYCNDGIVEYDEALISDRSGLVYEGGANPPDDTELTTQYAYRSLYSIIKRLVELGNEVHMYCGNLSAYETYQSTGAVLRPPTEYNKMMSELVNYKYGILIFNNEDGKKDQVNLTLTNKFHEYSFAGLPSIACWCPESEKLVEKWGVGFTFKHIDEIGDLSQVTEEEYREKMNNLKVFKQKAKMENFIWRLENLYAKVLKVDGKFVPRSIRDISYFEYGDQDTERILQWAKGR